MKKKSDENIIMGKRLKSWRLEKGVTVNEVASYVGVAPSTWREWENGRAISGLPYLKISQFFEVGLHEIFGISHTNQEILASLKEIEFGIKKIYNYL